MKKTGFILPLILFACALIASIVCAILGKMALCAQILAVGVLLAIALGGVLYASGALKKTAGEAAAQLEKEKEAGEKPSSPEE